MAGLKRPQSEDTDKTQSKKLKTDSTTKSDKKHALKMARKDSKSTKTPKLEGKGDLTIQSKERKGKSGKEKKEKKIKKAPVEGSEDELDEMEVDEVNEDEFQGLSTEPAETPAFRPLSDDEHSEEEGGDEVVEEKPAKKSKKGEEKAEVNPNNPNGTNSREAHAKQKEEKKARKAAKPNADEVQRAKKLWERLRRKSHVPKEERTKLVAELFEIISGRVKDFVFKHDSVRTIQTALKYASMPQRHMIADELKGNYKSLAESRYAKFLIGKLLVEGDVYIRDLILPEFYGNVRRLINHAEASWILDDVYRQVASKEQKAILIREWYGPEFAIFKSDKSELTGTLSEILAKNPEKRKPIMSYLQGLINQLIQKKLTGFTMLHDAMLQYFLNMTPGTEEMKDFLRLIIGDAKEEEVDLLKNLAFTKPGSKIVCLALAYTGAKDRKQILRSYKDTIVMLAADANAQHVLLTAYDVVDDTREITQRVFSELLLTKSEDAEARHEQILGMANEMTSRVPLLYPFAGTAKWLVNKPETVELVKEVHDIRTTTSKKDPEVRRAELITALSPTLLATIAERAAELVLTPYGCQFISEIILSSLGDKSAALDAVAILASGDPSEEGHISSSAAGSRMLKTLIAGGQFSPKEQKIVIRDATLGFADRLYKQVSDHAVAWATGESSFVIVGLIEAEGFKAKKALEKTLKASKKELKIASVTEIVRASKVVEDGAVEKKVVKKRKGGEEGPKGNVGARILLEKLGL
ncbi:ARM repeat-containing protein [Venturia nashicola]|uniref:ARM repeat-containing protein n=1 Tax=Venturia nashicola TaxID=86259 RepID=A0A4Z1PEF7_9PEZI|nr:ARM repeat-containing protein [Venturia nashicola]